jgi:hypothetical protein
LKANLDQFLEHEAFTGFESKRSPFTALWAAIPKHSLTEKVLNYYEGRVYTPSQETNTASVSRTLIDEFGINPVSNAPQIGNDGKNTIYIYPAEYFCLDLPPNFATHHFEGSWLDKKEETGFKDYVHSAYHIDKLSNYYYNRELTKYVAGNVSFKELVRIIFLYFKYKLIKK